jgi:hypothetical protein
MEIPHQQSMPLDFKLSSGNTDDRNNLHVWHQIKWSLFMGSITRSFANNIGSSGILTASAVTNTTIEDVTSFDNAASNATLVLLSTQTASASANISFTTGLDSTYDEYIFKFINIHPATDSAQLKFNLSTDAGSSYNVAKTTTFFKAYHNEAGSSTALTYETSDDLAQGTGSQFLSSNIDNDNDACW